jgi:simple sugar transport system substrate-binding protein
MGYHQADGPEPVHGIRKRLRRLRRIANMRGRLALLVAGVGIAAFVTAGCGDSGKGDSSKGSTTSRGAGSGATGKKYTFVAITLTDPFHTVLNKGMTDAGKALGVTVKLVVPQNADNLSASDWVNSEASAIASKPDALFTEEISPVAEQTVLKPAIAKGLPVAATVSNDYRPAGQRIPFLFFAGEDSREAGRALAAKVLAVRKPRKAVCALMAPGVPLHDLRCEGYVAAMKAAGVPANTMIAGTDATKQSTLIRGYFQSHSDVDALQVMGSATADVAGRTLKTLGKKDVLITSFDIEKVGLDNIDSGAVLATSAQQQYLQGYQAVAMMKFYLDAGLRPTSLATGPIIIDKSNSSDWTSLVEKGLA